MIKDKARLLYNYFASVFVKDNGLMPEFEPLVYDSSNKINVVYFPPGKVKAIKKVKTNGSGGDDKLPNILFFNVATEFAFPLSCIFNFSMTSSCVPSTWISGIVILIFKKGSTSNAVHYRPITLTCISCKIMDTIIKNHLISNLYSNKLISKHQHGFHSKHSTSTQLLECVNDWAIQISKKRKVDIAYLDFAKAFDSIVHKKLLFKLKAYGVDGLLLNLIESF